MNGAATHRLGPREVTQQRDGRTIDWDVPITLDEGWSCRCLLAVRPRRHANKGHENYPLLLVIPPK